MRIVIIIIISFLSLNLMGQNTDLLEEIAENGGGEDEEYYIDSLQRKIDLNTADKYEFRSIGLNIIQINSILEHRERYKGFLSIYELQAVENLSNETLNNIFPYIEIRTKANRPESFRQMLNASSFELMARWEIKFAEQDSNYIGTKDKIYFRAKYKIQDFIQIGFLLEKDAGEKYLYEGKVDFSTAYFQIKPNRVIDNIVIGDYHLKIGQGLGITTGTGPCKSMDPALVLQSQAVFKPYTSANEFAYFRGLALSKRIGNIEGSFMLSSKNIDASIDENDFISTIRETGYHRTLSEIDGENMLGEKMIGGQLAFDNRKLYISSSAFYLKYDKMILKNSDTLNSILLNEISINASVKQYYIFSNLAMVNMQKPQINIGILTSPNSKSSLIAQLRYYQEGYYSPYSNYLSEKTEGNNELGLLVTTKLKISRRVYLSLLFDNYYFPTVDIDLTEYNYGLDYGLQILYNKKRDFQFNFKASGDYKHDYLSDYYYSYKCKLQLDKTFSHNFSYRCRLEFSSLPNSKYGIMFYSDFKTKINKLSTKIFFRIAYINTPDFDIRFYEYENDLLYRYSTVVYYDKAYKFYVLTKTKINSNMQLQFKYSHLFYPLQDKLVSEFRCQFIFKIG